MKVSIVLTFVTYNIAYRHCTVAKGNIQRRFPCTNIKQLVLKSKQKLTLVS